MKRIAIIGGGAAGIMAAITAARNGGKVTIFEKNDRIGKKILATGNGKCNLGNLQLSAAEYYGSDRERIGELLQGFDTAETIRFFNSLGLLLKEKNGYLYPLCEQAAVVLDTLRFELQSLQVEVVTQAPVSKIQTVKKGFAVFYPEGNRTFDHVILTVGGKAAPKTGTDGSSYALAKQLGHTLVPQVPALVQMKCKEDYMKAVSGVRTEAGIRLFVDGSCVAEEVGELQLTDYGVSGIPVFQLSRIANYALLQGKKVKVHMDLLPGMNGDALEQMKQNRQLLLAHRNAEEFFAGTLNKKIIALFLRLAGIKPNDSMTGVSERQLQKVYALMKDWELEIVAHNGFENAQVTAGGVPLWEVKDTMESCQTPGLFLAGEVLDVDGKCGGYNLQWAWCSGYLAGTAASRE